MSMHPDGSMNGLSKYIDDNTGILWYLFAFIESMLRGIGQVIFCNSPLTGLFCLSALYLESITLGICATLGVVSATIIAVYLQCNPNMVRNGLYGFNGCLVGCGLAIFLPPPANMYISIKLGLWTIFGGGASVLVQIALDDALVPIVNIPTLTLPFNVTFLSILASMNYFNHLPYATIFPEDKQNLDVLDFFKGGIRGFGQIYLAGGIIPSILIIVGMMAYSRLFVVVAFSGSFVGALVGLVMRTSNESIIQGLMSYNAVLAAQALNFFWKPSFKISLFTLFVAGETTLIIGTLMRFLMPLGLPAATLPFCLATFHMSTMKKVLGQHRIAINHLARPSFSWFTNRCRRKKTMHCSDVV